MTLNRRAIVLMAVLGSTCVGGIGVVTATASARGSYDGRIPLEEVLGLPQGGPERDAFRELSSRVGKTLNDRASADGAPDKSPQYERLQDTDRRLEAAESSLYEAIAADPRVEPFRQLWRDCMGNKFESDQALAEAVQESQRARSSGQPTQFSLDEESKLGILADECTSKSTPSMLLAMRDVVEKWIALNSALGAEYRKALIEFDRSNS
jgi:hypothetical protein